ncbi:hypothetical protein HMPREF0591_4875 [Mycobacterium parascrofulaceum ATCC BAA-614]|uniref:Uncharacterized protein n=1 Tax=Mycobacterium parascrofulaceum ATCC BAA-614 TaxID=525368 RepID=D5PFC7_9MYCO|nr:MULTISPECIES: hypothetical protein [Mycobacterium]EFG75197.1 hypothetical protein HMPREF0591_4875 [Mycobacterium parascrofulaceum ATCC BAA-614]
MPQGWLPLARVAGLHGLKTRQAQEVAEKLGLRVKRGAALVSPAQQEKMRPELERLQQQKQFREASAKKGRRLVYESSASHTGFVDGDGATHLPFSNQELYRHLHPLLSNSDDRDEDPGCLRRPV